MLEKLKKVRGIETIELSVLFQKTVNMFLFPTELFLGHDGRLINHKVGQ